MWLARGVVVCIVAVLAVQTEATGATNAGEASASTTAVPTAIKLPPQIDKLLRRHKIPRHALSLAVHRARDHQPIFQLNSQVARNPASVIKVLTTLSALEQLGPDFRWKTTYLANGELQDGVLAGDLILRGGGDPFLTTERFWYQLQSLHWRGLHTITGDLIIDDRRFDLPLHDRAAFDGDPQRSYNVGPNASLVNFAATRFNIAPTTDNLVVFAEPPMSGLVVNNYMQAVGGKCRGKKAGWSYKVTSVGEDLIVDFRGKYVRHCGDYAFVRTLTTNNDYTYRLFKSIWTRDSGTFTGGYRLATGHESATKIATFISPPLADIITGINKYSNNVMARLVFLSLARARNHAPTGPTTLDDARVVMQDWLTEQHLLPANHYVDNGAGLSRAVSTTSGALAAILHHGWRSHYRAEFLSSFPLAAIDGTMRKRHQLTELEGRARIKTGSINGVRSMAGYLTTHASETYTVVMLLESERVNFSNGNQLQDAVLQWLDAWLPTQ